VPIPTVDLADPDTYVSAPPHEAFAELRRVSPVHRQETSTGGFWAVLKHADVEHVSRQPDVFSSAAGGVVLEDLDPPRLEQMRGMLLAMDPPRHREVRRPLVARLTPRAVARLADDISRICREIFDTAAAAGHVDFVSDVAAALPTRVIGQVMGLPPADRERMHTLAERITRGQDPAYADDAESAGSASQEMGLYAYEFASARAAAETQPDDLTAVLLAAHTPVEFASLFVQLVTAGQDTTATLLSSGLLALLQHPAQLELLRDEPSLVPVAVEEMLRWANPLHYFRRTATADTRLRGVDISAGDKVVLFYTSANRDEDVFVDPQRFDVRRAPNRHLSFGVAEHFCVGAHLARLEAHAFFTELLATFSTIELAGEPVRLRSNLNNALRSLPVRLARPAGRPLPASNSC
jgi:cytochrome P450